MKIKLTSKRQATFPRSLCEAMRLKPGDSVDVEARVVGGRRVWMLLPTPESEPMATDWVGSLRRYAGKKIPSMDIVRARILEAHARGELD